MHEKYYFLRRVGVFRIPLFSHAISFQSLGGLNEKLRVKVI